MSGLNPFRPRKSEDSTAHQSQHRSSRPALSSSIVPDPIFLAQSATSAVAVAQPNLPSPSARAGTTPPLPTNAPDLDDPTTSDDQSTSDPFRQGSDVSGDEAERPQTPSETPMTASPDDLRRPQEPIRTTPPFASSNEPSTTTDPSKGRTPEPDIQARVSNDEGPLDSTAIDSPTVSSESGSLEETDSDSTSDDTQLYTRTKTSVRPVSLGPGIDPRALASRSGNRDKVPPPPPKSHHGKLISPDLSITPPAPQITPGKAANRVSFHGSSPVPLTSPRMLQADPDYFGASANQSAPADTLRRSQSQNKRPPTPPLSRRHSQMRRSKSTLSKPASSQLSAPPAMATATASTPSSPGSRSLTPSLRSNSGNDSLFSNKVNSTFTLRSENIVPASSVQSEISGLGIQSNPRTTSKRASVINQLPPPPPPRRSRGSNQSNESNRPSSVRSEQRAGRAENFVSNPSNATDILADLTRLQQEVDDLRGHYETRRSQ
ncbi:hypothetical protein BDV12DRAFT_172596 [Aspergillus spectabilis]